MTASSSPSSLQQALALHQQGLFEQASAAYRQILAAQPQHAEALHLLGLLALQQGQPATAVELISQSLQVKPGQAGPCSNLGNALFELGQVEQALACHDQACRLQPDSADIHNNRGNVLLALQRPVEALADFSLAVDRQPGHLLACFNQASTLLALGRSEAAEAAFASYLAQQPEHGEAHFRHALALLQLGRHETALAALRRARQVWPGGAALVEIDNAEGVALFELQRHEAALAVFETLLVQAPDYAEAHYNRGNVLLALNRHADALASYDRALAAQPDYLDALYNRGNALQGLERIDAALACFSELTRQAPTHARAHNRRANLLHQLQRREEAIDAYRQALRHGGNAEQINYALASLGAAPAPAASPVGFVTSLFDQYAERFDQHLVGQLGYHTPTLLSAALRELLPAGAYDILDLGCGTGLCGPLLKPLAASLCGVDLSPGMLAQARAKGVYDQLLEGEITAVLEASSARYDVVIATDVFIYIGDLHEVFAGVRRVLRPGGYFAFSVESSDAEDFVLRPSRRYAQSDAYLRRLAAAQGLSVERCTPQIIRQEFDSRIAGAHYFLRLPG